MSTTLWMKRINNDYDNQLVIGFSLDQSTVKLILLQTSIFETLPIMTFLSKHNTGMSTSLVGIVNLKRLV